MAGTTNIDCSFDKNATWTKIWDRKPVVLDMNCWIDLAEDKSATATRVKTKTRDLVVQGRLFCPASFGIIGELYKQAEDSRLRVGGLIEELSLNVSVIPREEVFAWEIDRGIRRTIDVGSIDLSCSDLYVPVLYYLGSSLHLEVGLDLSSESAQHCGDYMRSTLEAMTLTQMLRLRSSRPAGGIFKFIHDMPAPKYSEEARRIAEVTTGDRAEARKLEVSFILAQYVAPTLEKLPELIKRGLVQHLKTEFDNDYGRFFEKLMTLTPAVANYVDLMATVYQFPDRKDTVNQFFDYEAMPVPMAYAAAFVSQDKGMRDLLRHRTGIAKRSECCYCSTLDQFDEWLDREAEASLRSEHPPA